MILDGWGIDAPGPGNAVKLAHTPVLDHLFNSYPHTTLLTSGNAAGLPDGIMGNSEVGHLNIGAGRIVFQDLLRIDNAIKDGSFFQNVVLVNTIKKADQKQKALHLLGLVSDGGVHSQLTHLFALLELAKAQGLKRVFVHAILDGRDTSPDSGRRYLETLLLKMEEIGIGSLASICGRFYAMDRDTRWERTQKAYRLYTRGEGALASDALLAVQEAYDRNEFDEFVKPIVLSTPDGRPRGVIEDGDTVLFFNFRADRARQITRAFTEKKFDGFKRDPDVTLTDFVCMTLYDEKFDLPMAFPPEHLSGILGEVLSKQGLHQLRIAETEKYAHVTYFFNGGEEKPFPNEDRCLIPSPREVATYDQKPQMSAEAVTAEVLNRIASDRYDVVVLNFANMDMVGHTGDIEAAVTACETVDACVGRIVEVVLKKGGALLITADHGNAETMRQPDGSRHTAHTTNPVALILVDDNLRRASMRKGILGDIAPTILDLLGIEKSDQMTGSSLVETRSRDQ